MNSLLNKDGKPVRNLDDEFKTAVLAGLMYLMAQTELAKEADVPVIGKELIEEWFKNTSLVALALLQKGGHDKEHRNGKKDN